MIEKTLFLTTYPYLDKQFVLDDLVDRMRDDDVFDVEADRFGWDEKEALEDTKSDLETQKSGYLIVEAPNTLRVDIITTAVLNDWKVVEFEVVLRETKSGDGKDE
jgi:hypothetical protein